MMEEITAGMDELGVLLMGHARGGLLVRLRLTIAEARRPRPAQQRHFVAGLRRRAGGLVFAIENPEAGLVEADELDHARALAICAPISARSPGCIRWTPLLHRGALFPEELDMRDPWQFANFRVT